MKKWQIKVLIIVSILVVGLVVIPTGYNMVSPGAVEVISPMINIHNGSYETGGEIMLTAVTVRRARLIHLLYANLFQPEFVRLEPKPDIDMTEYFELMQEMMAESQMTAKAVALQRAGYQPQISGRGAKIVDVLEYSDAYNKLEADDIIIKVDGRTVELMTDVREKIKENTVGDKVEITVLRDKEELDFEIITKAIEEGSEVPALGVLITSEGREVELPIEIDIDVGQIGGPSAGSMFALEIYNQLVAEDITAGNKIAGTGSIDLRGNVGKIDGIRQKIKTASDKGVDIFFLPEDNKADIMEWGAEFKGVRLIAVNNFDDILRHLNSL